ncbi:sensor histidine kinase [Aquisalinus flavus]|uniref:histidine kinase n=1 Tax=Aquisalinus flavus TaxID=1526572 RepID=A0A8J2V555_9PROT|nr:histidine kinase dimerization/phosphoacceptor domain -containing protein [Aquisalinus flavus]MBD0425376.1 PAS domain-containing protein [Aquisalinus flavus]UNE48975.1 PAS domain-containing protein [Aquisalinus flavus]GGD16552.1 histidine kinase [Aquisalinus flavus]
MPIIEDLLDRIGLSNDKILVSALEQLGEGVIVADANGRLVFINAAAARIHDVKQLDVEPDDYSDAYHLLTSEGEPHPPHDLPLARAVANGETVEDAHWKIRRPDGALVDAVGTARPIRDEEGKQVGSVLTMSDRTQEMETRRELDAALKAKDALLYEVNHRVKNNLALVSALLRLQAQSVDDELAKKAIQDLAGRIGVLEEFHRSLYQTGGHNEIDIVAFLSENMTDSLKAMTMENRIAIKVRTSGRAIFQIDRAVPLVLALNEMLLNSIKHAFANTENPEIALDIKADGEQLSIIYADNGCGLGDVDAGSKAKGIGRALIANLSSQLDATMETLTDAQGFRVRIDLPLD